MAATSLHTGTDYFEHMCGTSREACTSSSAALQLLGWRGSGTSSCQAVLMEHLVVSDREGDHEGYLPAIQHGTGLLGA